MNSVKLHWIPERKFLSHGIAGITAWLLMVALSYAGVTVSIEEGGAVILVVGLAFHYLMPPALQDILNRIDGDLRRALGFETAGDQPPDIESAARKVGSDTLPGLALIVLLMGGLAFAGPTACASYTAATKIDQATPAQKLYALQADFNSALGIAVAYVENDKADPDVVKEIARFERIAYAAVNSAGEAVRAGDTVAIAVSIAMARAAVSELVAYVATQGDAP